MEDPFKLLVIENNAQELASFREVLHREMLNWPIGVMNVFAVDLAGALNLLPHADGVITGINFPTLDGGDAEAPNGQIILTECLRLEKPAVWTSKEGLYSPSTLLCNYWGQSLGFEVFYPEDTDALNHGNIPWTHALYGLVTTVIGLETGNVFFSEDGQTVQTMRSPQKPTTKDPFGAYCCYLAQQWLTPTIATTQLLEEPILKAMIDMGFKRDQKAT